jgi:hypothetical protein
MNAFSLSFALLRIPRLFFSLFLVPLLLGIAIVSVQIFGSVLFLRYQQRSDPETKKHQLQSESKKSWIRNILLGTEEIPQQAKVCFWKESNTGNLEPTDPSCKLERYDVVIQPQVLSEFPLDMYRKMLDGYFTTIHICDGCVTDIVIWQGPDEIRADFRSFFGLTLFGAVDLSTDMRQHYVKALEAQSRLEAATGQRYLLLGGFERATPLKTLTTTFVIVVNVCLLIITALWLALKAHRRILDYFSHSGALLPLVAASGPKNFYSSIWLLTSMRVVAFIVASVPVTIWTFSDFLEESLRTFLFPENTLSLVLWILCLVTGLSLATLIASIAELKYNHSMISLQYKIIPMIACLLGGLIWGLTFLVEVDFLTNLRTFITVIPMVGISPIVMAPIFQPHPLVMAINFLFTLCLLIFATQRNSAWFAAHLDDI